jgi:hypothetical protein
MFIKNNFSLYFFKAYYDDELCVFEVGGWDGKIDAANITEELRNKSRDHNVPIDCMWIIEVNEGWKVSFLLPIFGVFFRWGASSYF